MKEQKEDKINHPSHYTKGGIEVISFIDSWNLGFSLGNCVKYIARANHKHESPLEDLLKARWYLNHEIEKLQPSKLENDDNAEIRALKDLIINLNEKISDLKQQNEAIKDSLAQLTESYLMIISRPPLYYNEKY